MEIMLRKLIRTKRVQSLLGLVPAHDYHPIKEEFMVEREGIYSQHTLVI